MKRLNAWAYRFQGKKWSYIFSIHGMTCTSLPVGVQGVSDRTPRRSTVCVHNCYPIWGPCTAHPPRVSFWFFEILDFTHLGWCVWRMCIQTMDEFSTMITLSKWDQPEIDQTYQPLWANLIKWIGLIIKQRRLEPELHPSSHRIPEIEDE